MLHRIYRYTGNSALLNTLVGLTVKVISTYGMGHMQWWQSIVQKTKNFGNPYGRDSMGPKLTELAWTAVLFKRLYWIVDVFIHSAMTVNTWVVTFCSANHEGTVRESEKQLR